MNDIQNQLVDDAKRKIFTKVIGQNEAKKNLGFYLENTWNNGAVFPHSLIKGPKGMGKTHIATAIGGGLFLKDDEGNLVFETSSDKTKLKKRPFIDVDCTTIKNIKQFVNNVIVKYVVDKQATIFLDETHMLPIGIQNNLLKALNPNITNRGTLTLEDYVAEIDFRKHTFIFATSEAYRMFAPLADRLEKFALEDYTLNEMADILKLSIDGLGKVETDMSVLQQVATILRGNAREAMRMANKIFAYVGENGTFGAGEWTRMKERLSIHPLGLNAAELQYLRVLGARTSGTSLNNMSAKTGASVKQLQQDVELYLRKHDLMDISAEGREITPKGRDYLRHLDGATAPLVA